MNKDIQEEQEKKYMDIFGEFHHQICEGLKCRCHKDVLKFITKEIKEALAIKDKQIVEAYKKGYSDGGIEQLINQQL